MFTCKQSATKHVLTPSSCTISMLKYDIVYWLVLLFLAVHYSSVDRLLMRIRPASDRLIGSAVMASPQLSPPLANAHKALSVPSLYCIQIRAFVHHYDATPMAS